VTVYRRLSCEGTVPFGYRAAADGLHLEADPAEQGILSRIRELKAAGHTTRQIADELNRQGFTMIGRARGMFLNRSENTVRWDGDLASLDDDQLAKMASFFESIAAGAEPGGNPEVPA
jgi:hypothetical protein